ncbi:MAG: 3-hydroxyacyl-ACP dehydratase FabZ [Deferribacterales bacterium]
MNIKEIMNRIPHRYPFLLVDKVLELNESSILAQKNVTFNEPFFMGHFPNEPIMPGVLQIEALAQAGGILISKNFEDILYHECEIFFMSIDNAKFRRPVIPGDVLLLKVGFINKKGNVFKLKGVASVEDKVATEAEFMAMFRRKQ